MSTNIFTEPRRKRTNEVLKQPLPIQIYNSPVNPPLNVGKTYIGELSEKGTVVVEDPDYNLIEFGFFGTSMRNNNRRKKTRQSAEIDANLLHIQTVIPDFSSIHKKESTSSDTKNEIIRSSDVFLNHYEAFFLCYGVGCLQIKNFNGDWMSIEDIWNYFMSSCDEFFPRYCTYHHFRAKGWIVKCGLKFGSDFLLYKWGPHFFHASYSVLVLQDKNISWRKIAKLNRVSESVAKELIMVTVTRKTNITNQDLSDFSEYFNNVKVEEVLVKRWIPTQER